MFAHNAMTTTSSAMILENTHSAKISFSAAGADQKTETGHRRKEKMMAEYIEREALLEALKEFRLNETMSKHLTREDCETARNAVERAQMVIERIPATDVAPVQHGLWIDNGACGYKWAFACSKCGYIDGYPFNDRHNYCPNCGARMDGAE